MWSVFSRFIKSICKFRHAMKDILTRSKFEGYLRHNWQDFSLSKFPCLALPFQYFTCRACRWFLFPDGPRSHGSRISFACWVGIRGHPDPPGRRSVGTPPPHYTLIVSGTVGGFCWSQGISYYSVRKPLVYVTFCMVGLCINL